MKQALIKGDRSDEWYTPKWCVSQIFDYYKPTGKILLPWDTDKSNFVKYCCNNNIEHVYNIRDFMTTDYNCDWIISNPPYSNKDEIIERCIEIGKPTVLLLPIESLGGVRRHAAYRHTKLNIYIPERRIAFISDNGEQSKAAAHHSIYLGLNFDEQKIEVE
ncbi:MAG: DNA N-6-adenine-methyltransferase [Actinomyces sp.]|nr:DNA N-6-adenine-methyltransferase [Actinomyces sp.]MDU4964773.1 DNA N-6-adenine-methyltransferase [Staphylococcus warneri]